MFKKIILYLLIFIKKNIKKIESLLFFAKNTLSERNFIYLSCILVALSCSFAVIILKSFAHNVFLYANNFNNYLKLPYFNSILPIIGILLTVFVIKKILKGSIEKGSSKILYAIAKKGGIISKKQMYAQIVTSSLTVGLGGSAGLESPIVITGAAFGSNYAQKYKISQKNRILLLACGVAAGISSAFNAPIAGVLFAIEVILTDVSISAFIPIMISSVTGALVTNILLNDDIILQFNKDFDFNFRNTPYYILLGILSGLVSVYHVRTFKKVEHFFSKLYLNIYKRALIGGLLLALLIFAFPSLFGEGYESIKVLASNNPEKLLNNTILATFKNNSYLLLLFVGIIVLIKSIATGITIGSGGNGGNFAPSLLVGSYLGFFLSKIIVLLGINNQLPVINFTIVGMAGILSGLFHAPLTAIFLISEITGGYKLMIPLMIVSSISYAISKKFEKYSLDVKDLVKKGNVYTSNKDKNILQSIDVLKIVKNDFKTINLDISFPEILDYCVKCNQPFYPIVNEKDHFLGLIYVNDIKKFFSYSDKGKHNHINEFLKIPEEIILYDDGVELILDKFNQSKEDTLVVIKYNKYIGTVSKLDILESYREILKQMTIE